MDYIKQLLFNRFKTFAFVSISICVSMLLLMVRMKLTHSFFFLFLVWNLFLAVIPFGITSYLVSLPKLNKIALVIWFGVWLLFLPNAPYIVTDLIHLRLNESSILLLDVLVVGCFAFTGLILFYLSIMDMKDILKPYLKKSIITYLEAFIVFLSAFGVYLGRFLRYNSWEILSNPMQLFIDIINIIFVPMANKGAWIFTFGFGVFLCIGCLGFKKFYSKPST